MEALCRHTQVFLKLIHYICSVFPYWSRCHTARFPSLPSCQPLTPVEAVLIPTQYSSTPSEVLRGLAINNTCGVPFLTFTWLLAMYFRWRENCSMLNPLVLYMLESSSHILHGQSLSHYWECNHGSFPAEFLELSQVTQNILVWHVV